MGDLKEKGIIGSCLECNWWIDSFIRRAIYIPKSAIYRIDFDVGLNFNTVSTEQQRTWSINTWIQ